MYYYNDNKTGNKLSVLGFGCMRFPRVLGQIDTDKSEAMVVDAVKRGVNYFDTAYVYPGSEEVLGTILNKNGLREKVFVATKLPQFLCRSYADFDKFFNKSLERLKTDYVDYYMMHFLSTANQWNKLIAFGIEKWITEQKKEKRIRQIGFSFHGKHEDFISLTDQYEWDFCMIQYNYIDVNNQAGKSGLKYAASKGIPVIVMEPLLGGRLANKNMLPAKVLDIMKEARPNYSPAAWALKWLWDQKDVSMVLSGMSSLDDLDENINLVSQSECMNSSDIETIQKIRDAFHLARRIPCTECSYCMPCPRGVNIPGCFTCYNLSFLMKKRYAMGRYMQETGALATKKGMASNCNNCGNCEKHCPQSIAVRKNILKVRKRLEPFGFRLVLGLARWYSRVNNKAG